MTRTPRPRIFAALVAMIALTGLVGGVTTPAGAYNDDGLRFEILGGPGAGEYPAEEFFWTIPVWGQPGGVIRGAVVYGGYGCPGDRDRIPDPSVLGPLEDGELATVVFQRGPTDDPNETGASCLFGEKLESGVKAGYDVVLIANNHGGAEGGAKPDELRCDPPVYDDFNMTVIGACIGHRAFHLLFSTTPDYTVPYPVGDPSGVEPDLGDLGRSIRMTSLGPPMLDGHSVLGQGWSTYAVLSPGGTVEFPIRLDSEDGPGQIGAWLYSSSDEFLGGVAFSSWRSKVAYFGEVKVEDVYELHAEDTVQGERQGPMSMTANITTEGPAIFKILLWGAGRKAVDWQSAARGPAGSILLGAHHGSSSFIARSRDFDAPANVKADAVAGARAIARGEYVVEVKDTLTASFLSPYNSPNDVQAGGVQANHMSIVTPEGEWECAAWSCGFSDHTGPAMAGPGTYRFRVTGAGAGVANDVMLSGVDARMPAADSAVGSLEAVREGDDLAVSGWAGFAGAAPALVGSDPTGDTAGPVPADLGYDLTGAYVGQPDAYAGDLRFVMDLAESPPPFGTPEAVRYLWDFGVRTAGGTEIFQIDGKVTDAATADSGSVRIPSFVLRGNCTGAPGEMACEKLEDLDGWADGHMNTLEVPVPRSLLEEHVGGSLDGAQIVAAEVLHGIATVPPDPVPAEGQGDRLLTDRDPYYTVVAPRVELGLTSVGKPATFAENAVLGSDGAFAAALDVSGLPAGEYELHARACFGEICGAARVTRIAV